MAQTCARGATNYVSRDGSHEPPYADWGTAATNIQTAIDYASTNLGTYDTVTVSNGTYSVTKSITITNGVTVVGFGGRDQTIVNGGGIGAGKDAIFVLSHAAAVVDGFTITNGASRGVNIANGTVRNCTLTKNTGPVWAGSGFYMEAGLISNCLITANSNSGHGGGGRAAGGKIVDCEISYNTAGTSSGAGAGVFCDSATPLLERCRIIGNVGNNEGGGIYGGTARNCLIANNVTLNRGGGATGGSVLENCTVVSNRVTSASGSGGGTSDSTLKNCIVYFNSAPVNPNVSGGTAIYTCSTPLLTGTGNSAADPLFVDLANGNYRLRYGSLAINAGQTLVNVPDDIVRTLRPQDGRGGYGTGAAYDMGCYETEAWTTGVFRCYLTASPSVGLNSLDATLTAYIAGAPAVTNAQYYWWDFGDGHTQEGADKRQVTHTFGPGLFNVALTVSNDQNSVAAFTQVAAVRVVADECYVAPGASNTFPYASWETAAGSIQDAVDAAEAAYDAGATDARVWVTNAVYTIASQVLISKGIQVQSVGAATNTIVTGNSFKLNHADALLSGFTVTNSVNRGVHLVNGTVRNCTLVKNSGPSNEGSGFYMAAGLISNCLITANSNSGHGGGGRAVGGKIVDCEISYNTAGGSWGAGAGLIVGGGSPVIERCQLVDNVGNNVGGAVYVEGGSPAFRNCLIARNSTANQGGGMYYGTLENCTVVSNRVTSASGSGGGTSGSTLKNCIVYFNSAANDPNVSGGTATYTCTTNPVVAGTGNRTADPMFVKPAAGNFRLQAASPCVDTGTTNGLTWLNSASLDLDGGPRVLGKGINMGAYESVPPVAGTIFFLR